MTRTTRYHQCSLRRLNPDRSSTLLVSYIPSRFASPNCVVRLKSDQGDWTDGWVVENVGQAISENELPNAHRAAKHHRKSTGDALRRPKNKR